MITANDMPVLGGRIVIPYIGIWYAEIDVDTPDEISGLVAISDGASSWIGYLKESRSLFEGSRRRCKIIGAYLEDTLTPRHFAKASVGSILKYIAGFSSGVLSSIKSRQLGMWSILAQNRKDAIKLLADELGLIWRVLPDGTIWIGEDSWDETSDPGVLVEAGRNYFLFGVNSLQGTPGETIRDQRITLVEHIIEDGALRTKVSWDGQLLESSVKHFTAKVDFFGAYFGTVIKQNTDKSLDVRMDDSRLPGFQKVPIRWGIPGISATVSPGSRVAVEFAGGSPTQPVATIWGSNSSILLEIDSTVIKLNGGVQPVARVGDMAGPWPITTGNTSVLA